MKGISLLMMVAGVLLGFNQGLLANNCTDTKTDNGVVVVPLTSDLGNCNSQPCLGSNTGYKYPHPSTCLTQQPQGLSDCENISYDVQTMNYEIFCENASGGGCKLVERGSEGNPIPVTGQTAVGPCCPAGSEHCDGNDE